MWNKWLPQATLLVFGLSPQGDPCSVDLAAFLNCNHPRVIQYLSALSDADIGSTLKGIKLTDGSYVAKGYRLLSLPKVSSKGAHVVVVQRSEKKESEAHTASGFVSGGKGAFVWVDQDGDPFPLPNCFTPAYENQYLISGDIYTWTYAKPGFGVIEMGCLNPSWLKK